MSTATTTTASRRLTIDEQFVRIGSLVAGYRPPNHVETSMYYVPESQREWSWKTAKQALFIDSIMLNYPIPSVICNCDEHGRYAIYDGRHRVETLWRFYNNELKWWDGRESRRFADLTDIERERFLERKLCVMVMYRATPTELGDIFERLNSGVRLTDSDLFWNRRETPLVSLTVRHFLQSSELSAAWGDINLRHRGHLANYVGIVAGLATADPNNFTTSYIRLGGEGGCLELTNIDPAEAERRVAEGVEALITLYRNINMSAPLTNKAKQRAYMKLGFINAFFLTDFLRTPSAEDRESVYSKWIRFVRRLRNPEEAVEAKSALTTKGAQNLTTAKIDQVLRQVDEYIHSGLINGRVPGWGGEEIEDVEGDSE